MSVKQKEAEEILFKREPAWLIIGLKWDNIMGLPVKYDIVEYSADDYGEMLEICETLHTFRVFKFEVPEEISEGIIRLKIKERDRARKEKTELETLKRLKEKYEGKD